MNRAYYKLTAELSVAILRNEAAAAPSNAATAARLAKAQAIVALFA